MQLYRPVGVAELLLIAAADWRAFPPRLPDQPIFYPVLRRDYAIQIARDWNTTDDASGHAGFVTGFEITPDCAARYRVEVVGGPEHQELWVPAEELDAFNESLVGRIEVLDVFYGARYEGDRPPVRLTGGG